MKKTLLVVLLALTMVFAFASMAMADGPALTVDGDDYAVAAKTDSVEISFKATGLTAGETYFVQSGSTKGAEVTVAESATTADLKVTFNPAGGWQHTGENESGSFDLMKKGTPDEKVATVAGPKVKVGSNKAELSVAKASTETAYVNIEKSTDGKTFTVYTDAASVKLALTASADATIDKGATLTLSADTTVKVSAQNGTEVTYTVKYVKVAVSISDLYSKSNASENSKLDVETDGGKKYIARDNGKGTVYFKVNGLESGMDVYVGGTKVTASSGVYKADYSADANAIIITVKKGSSTIISETYNMIRPTLDSILLYDDDNERKADEVTKFSSNFAATYTFDEDWEDLYILPIPSNAKYVETLEVEGDELDVDDEEWYDFALKKDTYEIEIDITVEVGSDKASQTYTLYVSNEDYEGGSIKEFIANDDDNSKSPFLSFVGKEKIYVFVPYDSEGDDIYFQALTGNDEDQISYDGSDAVDGDDDDEWYEAEKLEKITIEDEYGFTTTYEVVIYTADDDDLENDTELKDLALSTGKKTSSIKNDVDLTPEFDEDVKAYTAAVEDEDQIYGKISLKLADKNAYVFINDEFVGTGSSKAMTATIGIDPATTNKYEIVVVAEDCETDDTYTLTINGGNSTALKALTISGLSKAMSPAFNAAQLNYIGYTSAATATITATAESSACSVTIAGAGSKTGSGSATGTFNLAQGLNVFTITNYQKGMDSNVYSVSIYRVPDVKTIKVSKQNVTVNGASKTLTAYNINGNNFLQLRDVALLLSGTSKGFGVSFNDSTQSAYLTTGSTYVANGTENAAISNYTRAALSTQKFYLNNTAINPAAFNIDGSNYVMLRDLGVLLNFGITYSNNTIAINTNTNYVPGK